MRDNRYTICRFPCPYCTLQISHCLGPEAKHFHHRHQVQAMVKTQLVQFSIYWKEHEIPPTPANGRFYHPNHCTVLYCTEVAGESRAPLICSAPSVVVSGTEDECGGDGVCRQCARYVPRHGEPLRAPHRQHSRALHVRRAGADHGAGERAAPGDGGVEGGDAP